MDRMTGGMAAAHPATNPSAPSVKTLRVAK